MGTRASILADSVGSLIGAIYLDSQSFDTVKNCVLTWFEALFEQVKEQKVLKDAKSRLQELLQAHQLPLPRYEVTETLGNAPHQIFIVTCLVEFTIENKHTKQLEKTPKPQSHKKGKVGVLSEQRCAEGMLTKLAQILPVLR